MNQREGDSLRRMAGWATGILAVIFGLISAYVPTGLTTVEYSAIAGPPLIDIPWNDPRNRILDRSGIKIKDTPGVKGTSRLAFSADGNDTYRIDFFRAKSIVASIVAPPKPGNGMVAHEMNIPAEAIASGFDELRITPTSGDDAFSIGKVLVR